LQLKILQSDENSGRRCDFSLTDFEGAAWPNLTLQNKK
jgi:hypothetical protein